MLYFTAPLEKENNATKLSLEKCEIAALTNKEVVACGDAFNQLSNRKVTKDYLNDEKDNANEAVEIVEEKEINWDNVDLENFYQLLGFGNEEGLGANVEQITRAYRKMLMVFHPDKIGASEGSEFSGETDPRFLAMQKAYSTLTNADKRRGYDSGFDFDESIPSVKETTESEFYSTFGPVFKRNGRFSEDQPVPSLGSDDTPQDEVYDFYNFWGKMTSWRDFAFTDKKDLDTAGGRDHKRQMMKENLANRSKLKKEEYQRINKLVKRAQKVDPRLARYKREALEEKERIENEKKRIQEESEAKAKAEEDARIAKEESEAAAAKASKKSTKEAAFMEKKNRKKAQKKLKKAAQPGIDAKIEGWEAVHNDFLDADVLLTMGNDELTEWAQKLTDDLNANFPLLSAQIAILLA